MSAAQDHTPPNTAHPEPSRLSAFASGALADAPHRDVARHLAACDACAAVVVALTPALPSAPATGRASPDAPALPAGAFGRILARRAAGERVLLPADALPVSGEEPDRRAPDAPPDVAPNFLPHVVPNDVRHGAPGGAPGGAPRRSVRVERTADGVTPARARPAPRARSRLARPLLAAAAVLAVVVGALSTPPRELSATSLLGELRLRPARARPGDSVAVEYRAGALAAEPRLRLRARMAGGGEWAPAWVARHVVAAQLTRGRDGVYRGAFLFPDTAAYAQLVVEDATGARTDSRAGRLWEVLAHDAAGRPTVPALRQRVHAFYDRDRAVALETAREMARLRPDDPESRYRRLWYEQDLAGEAAGDSLRRRERPAYAAMGARLTASPRVPAADLDAMLQYAHAMGDTAGARRWTDRLLAEHPGSPEAAQWRVLRLRERPPAQAGPPNGARGPAAFLAAAEAMWARDPAAREPLALAGFMALLRSRDSALVRRWAERLEQFGPPGYYRSPVAFTLAEVPGLEAEGARRLRAHLAEFGAVSDAHRPLGLSTAQARGGAARTAAATLKRLGGALAALGQTRAALDTLDRATQLAWDADAYRALARQHGALGDTLAAARALAFAAVDPGVAAQAAALRRQAAGVPDADWRRWQDSARATMRAQLLGEGVSVPLRGRIRLADRAGRERELRTVLDGRPAVLAFWSRYCGGSLQELPDLQRAAAALARSGTTLVAVTAEAPSPALTAWLKAKGYTFPVYHDRRGEVRAAVQPFGTPDQVVVDGDGRVRFERLRAREVAARVALLADTAVVQ